MHQTSPRIMTKKCGTTTRLADILIVVVSCCLAPSGCVAFSRSSHASQNHRVLLSPSSETIRTRQFTFPSASSVPCQQYATSTKTQQQTLQMSSNQEMDDESDPASPSSNNIWSPQLRKVMGGIASLGVLETGYLTFTKLFTDSKLPAFCGTNGSSCESVLTGPYSTIPYTDIPLAMLGLAAYSLVLYLSVAPLLLTQQSNDDDDDTNNRILLTALTTCMGTFSIFLMSILFGVLHQACPYCIFSAGCSILLAQLAWIGGCLPEKDTTTSSAISKSTAMASSVLVPTAAALLLYFGSPAPMSPLEYTISGEGAGSSTLLASTGGGAAQPLYRPPEITEVSSERAVALAQQLKLLNAKMYGAHWCSHCYDQKQALGKEAFETYIKYIECSKDGVNSQSKLCKIMEVPGYPTWEIQGKLYPGELELEELEELVDGIVKK